jgi:hypothetical protein
MNKTMPLLRLTTLTWLLILGFVQFAWAVDEIVVGGWNIENLGRPDQRGGAGKGVPQHPADLANYIRSSEVHILGLEKISVDKSEGRSLTNDTLDDVVKILNSDSEANWRYRVFRPKGSRARVRLTAVMWNEAILKPVGDPLPLKVPGKPDCWKHPPTVMKFSAGERKTDIVIILIYMKSNRGGVGQAIKQRAAEAKRRVEWFEKVLTKFSDQDLIIIGDVNALNGSEDALRTFTGTGFVDLKSQDVPTYIGKLAGPLDRAFVPDNQPEFSSSNMEVVKSADMSPEEFRKKLSDYYMVKFTLNVMDDDD